MSANPRHAAAPSRSGAQPVFDSSHATRPSLGPEEAQARILADLQAAARESALRAADPGLRQRVQAVKAYQRHRLEASYADFLADRRHARAVRFFIDELYSPQDSAQRHAQIASIVPTLVRAFPRELVDTVAALAAWHALSESLDSGMGRRLDEDTLSPQGYETAWRAEGRAADRRRQVELMLDIGRRLDRHARDPLLMGSLRLMRGPALFAGLGGLQQFLESGLDAFATMRGAERLLAAIEQREHALAIALSDPLHP
ncbi:MAG: hypothetical protein QM674_14515 [Burkholderiaceae bacterium]